MITTQLKERVIAALAEKRAKFAGTDKRFAISIGINYSIYSRLKNGDTDKILNDAIWISFARKYDVSLNDDPKWITAETPVYEFITRQLKFCQDNHASRILCDFPDIGKTYTAREFVKENQSSIYVDCAQVKTKQKLVRYIAKEFGVGHTGKYSDVYADLVFYLRTLPNPLILLDEAGDLDYPAFLELKALWNATERTCGWYMMGADGLKEKMRRSIDCKKVGYTELFSRYGSRYQKASPDGSEDFKQFKVVHAAMIIKANLPTDPPQSPQLGGGKNPPVNIQQMIVRCDYSLRRIADELRKIQG